MRSLLTLTLLILLTISGTALAQSSDRDNPTPLASNTIKGNGVGKKVEYYYSFNAGPGEVVLTIDLKAKAGSTNADIEIFDGDASKVFYYYPNATSQNERAVKRVTLSGKQLLILRLALDSSAGEFSIKLAGPVELASALPIIDASASAPDPSPASVVDQAQPPTSNPTSDVSMAVPAEVLTSTPGKTSKLNFGINILQAVGTQFGLPTSGVLHIVMKDGTTQDLDLSKVKSASVNKP